MRTERSGARAPAHWLAFACGLALLAICMLAASASAWTPPLSRLWARPLQPDPDAALPAPTRFSRRQIISTGTEGIKTVYRRELNASIPADFSDVLAFYRTELPKLGWQDEGHNAIVAGEKAELNFTSPKGPATLKLGRAGGETTVRLVQRNIEAAAKANVLPTPGQARLIFGYLVPNVATLAIDDQIISIEGGRNHPQALDLAPGTYTYQLVVSGHLVTTSTITVAAGEAWDLSFGSDGEKSSRIY